MKYVFSIIIFICAYYAWAEETKFISYDIAAPIPPQGQISYSLFAKAEYGINDALSVRVHPIMLFVSPVIDLKYNFYKNDKLTISSIHSINYPTLLLTIVKAKGTGGLISPEFDIPNMFSITNTLIGTYKLDGNHIVSGSFGVAFALNTGDLEPGTSIDLPIILPKTMVYYKNLGIYLNCIGEGEISSVFDYHIKSDLSLFPLTDDKYDKEYPITSNALFWELSGLVFIKITETFKLGAGTILCYGQYPFGTQWHLLPLLDFVKVIE